MLTKSPKSKYCGCGFESRLLFFFRVISHFWLSSAGKNRNGEVDVADVLSVSCVNIHDLGLPQCLKL